MRDNASGVSKSGSRSMDGFDDEKSWIRLRDISVIRQAGTWTHECNCDYRDCRVLNLKQSAQAKKSIEVSPRNNETKNRQRETITR